MLELFEGMQELISPAPGRLHNPDGEDVRTVRHPDDPSEPSGDEALQDVHRSKVPEQEGLGEEEGESTEEEGG